MYSFVLPKFTELEKEAGIPEVERFKYAICYGSLFEEPNEIILLEDLQISDFVMLDKTKSLSDETAKLVIKNFARLHSLSHALKKLDPEIYEDFKNKLANRWSLMLANEDWKPTFIQTENLTMSMLDNAKHKNLVQGAGSRLPQLATKNYKIDKGSKYSVIQQGDSWTNNMLFKLEGDKSVQCCMIDYQLASENSPVADLHYMLFSCTDHETRSKHYHEWIDYYHDQLDKSLNNFGLKVNFVYPRDQLDADLKRFGKYSFGIALLHAGILLMDAQRATKMKEAMKEEAVEIVDTVDLINGEIDTTMYRARIKGLIDSFLEFGYF